MTYNKKSIVPVIMFIFWSILLALVCVVGITGVFAAEYTFSYNDTQTYYDNLGSSVTYVNSSWNESLQAYVSDNINTTANSYGAGVSINAPIPILENHTYTLTLAFPDLSNIALSSKNHIALSISGLGAANNYAANNYYAEMQYSTNQSNKILQFVFKATGNASYIFIPWTTTYTTTQSYFLNKIIIEDLGSEGVSQDQINISLGNQTSQIQDSLNNTENNIKNEIKNTEDNIKDSIKDGFESCRDSYNLFSLPYYSAVTSTTSHGVTFIVNKDGSITISGQNDGSGKSIFYLSRNFVLSSGDYKFTSPTNNLFLTFYFDKKYVSTGSFTLTSDTTIGSAYLELGSGSNSYDNYTFYPMLNKGTILRSFETPGEKICSNRIDDTNKKLDEQNETSKGILGKIKDLFNWLTNKDDADVSNAGNVAGWLPAGPVDSLITLPLTFLTNVNTSLSKTCSPLDITLPYVNKNVQIPCLNTIFNQITGVNSFWTWVGTISSVVILFKYLVALYDYFDRLTTLQANFISDWGGI